MTPVSKSIPALEITLEIRLGYGRFSTLVFDTSNPPDFCAGPDLEWRTSGAKSAPLHSGAYTQLRAAQTAPLSLPSVARAERVVWVRPAPYRKSGAKKQPQNTPQEDLLLAREIISDLASDLASLDSQLSPVRDEERGVRERILKTHGERDGVVVLNLNGAGDRAPLFSRLSAIAKEWGPVKTRRGNLHRQIKSLERHIEHLQKFIAAEGRKKRKA